MPNDQDLVVLDPFEVVTGRTLTAGAMAGAPKVANHVLGAQHTHAPLFSFSRPDPWISGFSFPGATMVLAAPIRLMCLGDGLPGVRAHLLCSVGAGDGITATVATLVEGDSTSALIAPGGMAEFDLGVVSMDLDFDDFTLTLLSEDDNDDGGSLSTIDVYGLRLVPEPAANPLPAGPVDGASPLGIDRFSADEMHGAAHNRMLRDAASVGYRRRRMIWSWVAADSLFGGPGQMSDYLHMAPFMPLIDADETIHVHVNVDNFGGLKSNVYPLLSLDAAGPVSSSEWKIVVDADAVGWVDGEMKVPEIVGDGFGTFPVGWVGIQPGDDEFTDTVAAVLSISMWAEGA